MSNTAWLQDNGQNQISVKIADKWVPLRYTVSQQEKYTAMLGKAANEAKETKQTTLIDRMQSLTVSALDVCEIALNPKPNEITYSREQISETLDLDQIALLAEVWIQRKVFSPSLEKKI